MAAGVRRGLEVALGGVATTITVHAVAPALVAAAAVLLALVIGLLPLHLPPAHLVAARGGGALAGAVSPLVVAAVAGGVAAVARGVAFVAAIAGGIAVTAVVAIVRVVGPVSGVIARSPAPR